MKPLFCPRCHKPIVVPKFLRQGNVKAEKGVTLKCADAMCKGTVKFYSPSIEAQQIEREPEYGC